MTTRHILVRRDTGAAEYELLDYKADDRMALVRYLNPVWTTLPLDAEWFRQRFKLKKVEDDA